MRAQLFALSIVRMAVIASALLVAGPSYAGCPPWHLCQLENAKNDVVDAGKDALETAKDAVATAVGGVKDGVVGAGKVLRGTAELATGHPGVLSV